MKLFIVSDIHGDYYAFSEALRQAGYDGNNPKHQLISLGDNFGRATKSNGDCIDIYVWLTNKDNPTPSYNDPICICGNHELILKHIIRENYLDYIDIRNGEHKTIGSFARISFEQAKYDREAIQKAEKEFHLTEWIDSLPFYFETKHYVFTHGWVPPKMIGRLNEISKSEWEQLAWCRTDLEYFKFLSKDTKPAKDIVVGHWGATHLFEDIGIEYPYGKIFNDNKHGVHFIDCTTAAGKGMEVLVLEDDLLEKE